MKKISIIALVTTAVLGLVIGGLLFLYNQETSQAIGTRPKIVLTPNRLTELQNDASFLTSDYYTQTLNSWHSDGKYIVYGPTGDRGNIGPFLQDGSRVETADKWLSAVIMLSYFSGDETGYYDRVIEDMVEAWLQAPGYDQIQAALPSDPDYASNNKWWAGDFNTDNSLIALSIAYDWKYDHWTPTKRQEIADKVATELGSHFNVWGDDQSYPGYNVLGNHAVQAYGAMLTATYVAEDSSLYNSTWRTWLYDQLNELCTNYNDDGAYYEGAGTYLSSHMKGMPIMVYLKKTLEGQTASCPYLQNLPDWVVANTYPGFQATINNGHNGNAGGYQRRSTYQRQDTGAWHMLSRVYNSTKAEFIARYPIDNKGILFPQSWSSEVFDWPLYDYSRPTASVSDFSTFDEFSSLGAYSYRTNWDEESRYLYFQCGNPIGIDALNAYNVGSNRGNPPHADASHLDPDQCSFIYSYGEYPILMDTGYSAEKKTQQHNLPAFPDPRYTDTYINSNFTYTSEHKAGQFGAGNEWNIVVDGSTLSFWPPLGDTNKLGQILEATNDSNFLRLRGDATDVYYHTNFLKHVEKYYRGLYLDKTREDLIIVDTAQLDQTGNGEYYWQVYNTPTKTGDSWEIAFREKDENGTETGATLARAYVTFLSPNSFTDMTARTPIATKSFVDGSYDLPTNLQNSHIKVTLTDSDQMLVTLVTEVIPTAASLTDNGDGTYDLSYTYNGTTSNYTVTKSSASVAQSVDSTGPAAVTDLNAQIQ